MKYLKTLQVHHRKHATCLFLVACLSICGCSAKTSELERDVRGLETKLADIRSFQAEQANEINSLSERVRHLTGKIEELEFGQSHRVDTDLTDLKEDVSTLRRRVPPPPIVPVIALEADEVLADRLRPNVGSLLKGALEKVRTGDYRGALAPLEQGLELNFGGEGSAEILFWEGVCYDGLGDNSQALRAYNELISGFPKHPRTALGLLRQGSVFIRLGDVNIAKVTFQKLIADFPKTSEAARAKERLRDL